MLLPLYPRGRFAVGRTGTHSRRNLDRFVALTRKYVDIPELTPTIVNEFVKKIVVYEHSGVARSRTQGIRIVFNFLDEMEYPARENEETATKAIETAQNTVIVGCGGK